MKNCPGCNAVFDGHRWVPEPGEDLLRSAREKGLERKSCPGCVMVERGQVEGVVTLRGGFLKQHFEEVENLVNRVARTGRQRNVTARVLDEKKDGAEYVIQTTDTHLAERIGKEMEKAFKGNLDIKWQEKDSFVRVSWHRD